MELQELLQSIFNFLSSTFGLPVEWLVFPQIVFLFVIPVITLIFLWWFLLNKTLRIFKNSTVNFGLSIVTALISTPLIPVFSPAWILAIAIGGSLLFSGRITPLRAIVALILFFVSFYIYANIVISIVLKLA